MREYNAESPKKGRKRFNYNVKTIDFDHLVIIFLCTVYTVLYKSWGNASEEIVYNIKMFFFNVLTNPKMLC